MTLNQPLFLVVLVLDVSWHCRSVYLIFLTCFVLFILAAILFPFGTTMRKVCQAVENPQYEVFEQVGPTV